MRIRSSRENGFDRYGSWSDLKDNGGKLYSTVCEPGHRDMIGQRKQSLQEGLQVDNGTRSTDLPAMTVGILWESLCCEGTSIMAGTFTAFIGCGVGPLLMSIY